MSESVRLAGFLPGNFGPGIGPFGLQLFAPFASSIHFRDNCNPSQGNCNIVAFANNLGPWGAGTSMFDVWWQQL
jgi:hypothetical protein